MPDKAYEWIEREKAMHVISIFASTHFRRHRALELKLRMLHALVCIQAWLRGNVVRQKYRGHLLSRLEATKRFEAIWEGPLGVVASFSSLQYERSWARLKKEEHDVVLSDDVAQGINEISETSQKLEEAVGLVAAAVEDGIRGLWRIVDSSVDCQVTSDVSCADSFGASHSWQPAGDVTRIKLTGEVVKWLRQGDSKYRDFFIRRINQLATGERSRILAKRLDRLQDTHLRNVPRTKVWIPYPLD